MAHHLHVFQRRLGNHGRKCAFMRAIASAARVMPWDERAPSSNTGQISRVAVGCDHMGLERKRQLIEMLQQLGHDVQDYGTDSTDRCDYPDYAATVGKAVVSGAADWGLLVCGTGAGMSMAANKVPGVRAALASDTFTAKMTRRHNAANVLCIGSWVVGQGLAREILEAWLASAYEGGRHQRRVDKMSCLEDNSLPDGSIERLDVGQLDVLTMGEILVEVMRPEPGTPLHQTGWFRGPYPSGAPAIFIDAAARLGFSAAIVGGIGADDFGRNLQARLQRSGVRNEFLTVVADRPTGTAHVTYFGDGTRKFVFHIDGTAAVAQPAALPSTPPRLLHIMGCSLMATESMRKHIIVAMTEYHAAGTYISFDPNIRAELLGGRPVLDVVGPVLERCTVLLPGLPELRLLASSIAISMDELTEASCASVLFERYAQLKVIVVKRGSAGAAIYAGSSATPLPVEAVPVEEADATGAGDSFDAAFMCGWLAGLPLPECGAVAARAGAACAAAFGPMEGHIDRAAVAWPGA